MARKLKEYLTEDLRRKLPVDSGFVAVDYKGLNAEETLDFRQRVREAGADMHVVPNRIALRVLGESFENGDAEALRALFRGPTALVLGEDDSIEATIAAARAIVEWRKKNADKVSVKGGRLSGKMLDTASVIGLANLPDQKTLLSQAVGVVQAPLRNVVSVVAQALAKVAYAARAYAEKLEAGGGAAAPGSGDSE